MKVKGQKLKNFAKKARAANKRRVAFFPKIATRWIYFIHIFRQLLVPNLSKSEKKSSVLALVPYYTDYKVIRDQRPKIIRITYVSTVSFATRCIPLVHAKRARRPAGFARDQKGLQRVSMSVVSRHDLIH